MTVLTKGCASKRKEEKFEKKAPKVPKLEKKTKPKWKLQAEGGLRPAAWQLHTPYKLTPKPDPHSTLSNIHPKHSSTGNVPNTFHS